MMGKTTAGICAELARIPSFTEAEAKRMVVALERAAAKAARSTRVENVIRVYQSIAVELALPSVGGTTYGL